MPDKIVKFIECGIPVTTCNFKCHYCYITQMKRWADKLPVFKYTPAHIAKALSKKRMGGTCLLNMCGGGETLLPPEMTDIIRCCLAEGHYVSVVTNGTVSKRIDEIVALPKDLLKRLFFKFSFQYLELKRTRLMEKFFDNVRKVKQAGCAFTVELTTNDEVVPFIDDIKKTCMENLGALCHLTIARDDSAPGIPRLSKYTEDEARQIWGSFESSLFDFKLPMFGQKRTEFCYAGAWSYVLDFGTGWLYPCYGVKPIQNIFEDLDSPIISRPIGHKCPYAHCFNNHSFLCLGDIPEFSAPTYAALRDRVCADGTTWLNDEFRAFFSSKLYDTNPQLTRAEKRKITRAQNKKPKKYYKYKLLSKITFGQTRQKYKRKFKQIKDA